MSRSTVLAVLAVALAALAPMAASLVPSAPVADFSKLAPEVAAALPAGEALPVIVRFVDADAAVAFAPELEGRAALPYRTLPGYAFTATAREVLALAAREDVAFVELDAPLPVMLPTATLATRAQAVWGAQDGGPMLLDGRVIDGAGVGVAVIDTGVDATNPYLGPNVVMNVKVVGPRDMARNFYSVFFRSGDAAGSLPEFFVPMDDTDVGGGHGTHVAGIVAANGPDGRRGAAPGASIYSFGTGAGLSLVTSSAVASWDWIVQNHDKVDPPIRIVSNSYSTSVRYSENLSLVRMTNAAVEAGLVVLWAAGNGDALNNGGNGTDDRVNPYGHNPRPGVLTVANYDDGGNGTRDGQLAFSSSRGRSTDPQSWPDVSAPGSSILSTRAKGDPLAAGVDALLSPFEPDGNPFGNAINQFRANVTFTVGGRTGAPGFFENGLGTRPLVVYNGHSAAFAYGRPGGALSWADPAQAAEVRYYAPLSSPVGPVRPLSDSDLQVQPGDHVRFQKTGGTARAPTLLVMAPDGQWRDVVLRAPCDAGCTADLDLHALFPDAPADGTWHVAIGRSARPERTSEGLAWTESSGTSMATPLVAGIVALMLQADPTLTPAEVEAILESTAYKFAFGAAYVPDPYHPGGTSSYDKGHGLVDAHAAVLAALSHG